MDRFADQFTYIHRSRVTRILKDKLERAYREKDNFLLYVRNPVKVLILLNELLTRSLKMTSASSHLSYETRELTKKFSSLA